MKTLEDWKDAYYEQQALHTEATGMLAQERDSALRELTEAKATIASADRVSSGALAECLELRAQIERLTLLVREKHGELILQAAHAQRLAEALRFYADADVDRYINDTNVGAGHEYPDSSAVAQDRGSVARAALSEAPAKPEGISAENWAREDS